VSRYRQSGGGRVLFQNVIVCLFLLVIFSFCVFSCNVIVVAHGITLRAFAMAWLSRTHEWFESQVKTHKQTQVLVFMIACLTAQPQQLQRASHRGHDRSRVRFPGLQAAALFLVRFFFFFFFASQRQRQSFRQGAGSGRSLFAAQRRHARARGRGRATGGDGRRDCQAETPDCSKQTSDVLKMFISSV
jgi:hypothetical protein